MTTIMTTELSPDLIEEILCRVPATNLNRLRITCKGWNRLIKEDRRFQMKHLEKASKKQYRPLLLRNDCRVCSLSVDLHREVKIKKLRLIDPRSMNEFDIYKAFHCDGLLVCTPKDGSMIVVWNPCTGETKWIRSDNLHKINRQFYIGYCKDKSGNKRYKLLSKSDFDSGDGKQPSLIYDIDSDSWRIVDHVAPGWSEPISDSWRIIARHTSLEGNIYWIGGCETYTDCLYVLRFDFSTEKSQHLPLPYLRSEYRNLRLSVVRDEKLCVLVQPFTLSKSEIWVTNKIDDITKAVSWSKVLILDLSRDILLMEEGCFLLDEEKKEIMCCERRYITGDETSGEDILYIVGEDNKVVSRVKFGLDVDDGCLPDFLNYCPSLVQIKPACVVING